MELGVKTFCEQSMLQIEYCSNAPAIEPIINATMSICFGRNKNVDFRHGLCYDNIRRFVAVAKKYTELTELSTEILHDFIQIIVVHAPDKSSGKRVVQLAIYYNSIGKINE